MRQKEKVILFGKGMVYQRKKEFLFENYEVMVFLDNGAAPALSPITDTETGIKIVNPEEISAYGEIPVILLSYALGDMYRQLLELGVEEKRIRFGPMIGPFNTFEEMLFGGGGELVFRDGAVFYVNRELDLCIKTDSSDLQKLTEKLKNTSLYPGGWEILDALPLRPLDDTYGMNRGTPVDRYYIERFLEAHKEEIHGTVMEIGDRTYTRKFGGDRVMDSMILHVEREVPEAGQIKGDLATGEGLAQESVDCLICTQTLPFIYDLPSAADNIVNILKKNGTALITVAGISQIIQYEKVHYGHFWSFTDASLRKLFADNEAVMSTEVVTYGNVKTAAAFLYGLSCEEIDQGDLDFRDENYQLIVAAVIKKK